MTWPVPVCKAAARMTVAFGAAGAAFLAWVWGSLAEPPFIHDEAAYLLQADIFAAGRLSAPAPPLPEFFEQYHVLVTPRLAPKYPPAHALMLVPGMWLGLPGLMPVALHGLAGAMLFALARRLANPHLVDLIPLDEVHSIITIQAPKAFHGKTLQGLRLRNRYRVNLVAIKRPLPRETDEAPPTYKFIGVPTDTDTIADGDVLLLIGSHEALAELPRD